TRAYTWWDYQGRSWRANQGLRIDHLLLSPHAIDRLETCAIDRETRAAKSPSDHAPEWCTLSDGASSNAYASPGAIAAPAPRAGRPSSLRDVPAGLPARTPACKRACKGSHRREGSMKRLLSLTLASASALIVAGQVAWAEFPEKDLLG